MGKSIPLPLRRKKFFRTFSCAFFFITGVICMPPFPSQASSDSIGQSSSAHHNDPSAGPDGAYLTADAKEYLLRLARQSLEACVNRTLAPKPENVPESVKAKQGCFVTLTKGGNLRGCIGYLEGIKPLYEAVIENAQNAALSDPRFPGVSSEELPSIVIEISALTPPRIVEYKNPQDLLDKLAPGQDGIILQKGFHQSTYLPQVWEQLPDKVQFLENLSLKGGMDPDGWKSATVKRYRAIHFQEHK